jgi:separase
LATVECARLAFAALRAAKGPLQADQTDLQLETGMSTLIGKLLSLNMHDQALKEMRILKRRLDAAGASEEGPSSLAALLRYQGSIPAPRVAIAVNCQLQVLKLAAATKRPSHIESLLPELRESHSSSPLNLLSLLAKQNAKAEAQAARHLDAV